MEEGMVSFVIGLWEDNVMWHRDMGIDFSRSDLIGSDVVHSVVFCVWRIV
jgi:hypothetical protein